MSIVDAVDLSRTESIALRMGRWVNERAGAKRVQTAFLCQFSTRMVHTAIGKRLYVVGYEHLQRFPRDRGLLLCANHRTFFDFWAAMLVIFRPLLEGVERIYFPVRSSFFYESPLGMLLNLAVGGGCMYPPIFRDPTKGALNEDAIDRLTSFLEQPGTIVGMHPEGRRNKGDDPYAMLPAQPGVGQLVLRAQPTVVPLFINGLSPTFGDNAKATLLQPEARYTQPVVVVFGPPLDYAPFAAQKPRLTLYKRVADAIHQQILACSELERTTRAQIASRQLDNGPGWHERC